MALVHRYGEACRHDEHTRAGVLYFEIVRALGDAKSAPPGSHGEDPDRAEVRAA